MGRKRRTAWTFVCLSVRQWCARYASRSRFDRRSLQQPRRSRKVLTRPGRKEVA